MHRGNGRADLRRLAAVGALLVLAGLALALRRDHRLPGPGDRSAGIVAGVLVLVVACWVVAYLFLARTSRSRVTALAFSTAAFGVLAVVVMVSAPSRSPSAECETVGTHCEQEPMPTPTSPAVFETPRPHHRAGRGTVPIGVLLLGAAVITVVAVAALGYRRRSARVAEPSGDEPRSGALRTAVEAAGYALSTGDAPREAVIACYAAMEQALARSGAGPRPSDSPAEVLGRAAARGLIRGENAEALTELFRRARFSRHPVTDDDVRRARDALAAVRDDLGGVLGEVP
ncbi:DUF4129 domain-containing protein [Actinomadura terrae]|uniref:DUF4129 domain-containing protein n=1 Tax=Actinomadura terrae TaxID=604353 RepID=UPI001FA6F6A2|nr:DUF4129 domain-containing protein [Actinomadura terrae]